MTEPEQNGPDGCAIAGAAVPARAADIDAADDTADAAETEWPADIGWDERNGPPDADGENW